MTWTRRAPAAETVRRRPPRRRGQAGSSLLEVLVVVALLGIVALHVGLGFGTWRQRVRLEAAVRRLSQEVGRACAYAGASGRTHGLMLDADAADLRWTLIADGDGDGLSTADVAGTVDVAIGPEGRLQTDFPGIRPGLPVGVPTVAGGATGSHGVAFGSNGIVSCSPAGGARAGTVYLRSMSEEAAALRVYGPTARLSLWWWSAEIGAWTRMR